MMKFIYPIILSFFTLIGSNEKTSNDLYGGILVSGEELIKIRESASEGIEPHHSNVTQFLAYVDDLMHSSGKWEELSGEVVISGGSSSRPIQLSSQGGKLVYGTAIAWHLTQKEKYAVRCRELILDLTDTYGYRNSDKKNFIGEHRVFLIWHVVEHPTYMPLFCWKTGTGGLSKISLIFRFGYAR